MKKFIALLQVAVMLLSLAACGSKETKPTEPAADKTPAIQTEAPADQTEPAPTEAEVSTWGVPQNFVSLGQGFYVSFPEWSGIPEGYGLIAYQPDNSMCLIDVQNADSPEVSSVEEVLPAYFEQTETMFMFYYDLQASDFEYLFEEQELVTINGVEMCRYVGHMQFDLSGVDTDYKFAAYSTQLSNGAYIYFMTVDETPDQSLGDSIEDCAYNMALSFHEYDY